MFSFKASSTNASVLIYGESGTGKELAARAIHNMSRRSGNNLVPVNCGALPDNLFESQFFGYRKGAFTGADQNMAGFLDMADQGTLFLDEIGNIALKNQVRLLRAIDRGEYIPVGGTEIKKSDFRLISATNSDLAEEVRQGRMRADFFYRIHVMPIRMPSLRERREDIPLLVDYFLEKYAGYGPHKYLSDDMFSLLLNYNWPGNIRELQNVIQRFVALGRIELDGSGDGSQKGLVMDKPDAGTLQEQVFAFEHQLLVRNLKKHKWHREKTAKALGLSRRTFFRKLNRHGLIGG